MMKVGRTGKGLVLRLVQRQLGHSKKGGDPSAQLENRRRGDGDRGDAEALSVSLNCKGTLNC